MRPSPTSHGPALDAYELLIAFCPAAKLDAVEQTQVMLARTEARSGGPSARSVRLRLAMPLPPGIGCCGSAPTPTG